MTKRFWVHRKINNKLERRKVVQGDLGAFHSAGYAQGYGPRDSQTGVILSEDAKANLRRPHLFTSKICTYGYSREEQISLRLTGYRFCGWHKKFEPEDTFGKKKKACRDGCRLEQRLRAQKYGSATVKNFALVGLYDRLMSEQGGHCALCSAVYGNAKNTRLCFDHDHACCRGTKPCKRCVRGLLCNACNYHLGKLEDLLKRGLVIDRVQSVGWTAAAVVYLVNHANKRDNGL